jgi:hypothetical protein
MVKIKDSGVYKNLSDSHIEISDSEEILTDEIVIHLDTMPNLESFAITGHWNNPVKLRGVSETVKIFTGKYHWDKYTEKYKKHFPNIHTVNYVITYYMLYFKLYSDSEIPILVRDYDLSINLIVKHILKQEIPSIKKYIAGLIQYCCPDMNLIIQTTDNVDVFIPMASLDIPLHPRFLRAKSAYK